MGRIKFVTHKIHQWFKLHWMGFIGVVTGVIALFLTQLQLLEARDEARQSDIQHQELMDEAKKQTKANEINNAWGILAHQGGGNMGKKEALETLAKYNIPLIGVDVVGEEDNEAYLRGLHLTRVFFGNAKLDYVLLHNAVFNNVYFAYTTFNHTSLLNTRFENSELLKVDFSTAMFFDRAIFTNCWVSGKDKKEVSEYRPSVPPDFKVIITDRKHFDNGKHDGYYIEIKKKP